MFKSYNSDNSYLFVNGKKIIKFKAKDSAIVLYPLCLRNISTDFNIRHMLKTGLGGYIYHFSVDYRAISNYKIQRIYNYLMKKKTILYKMFWVIKKIFVVTMKFLVSSVNSLECVSMKNQEYKIRSEIINTNNNQHVFYPFSIKVNKCSGRCNVSNPYARLGIPDVVKNINLKVFNLMSRCNQTKQINWHESCKCECKLNSSACNNKRKLE